MLDRSLNIAAPFGRADGQGPEWRVEPGFTPYPDAVAFMEARAAQIAKGEAQELVWLVEHPPLYTAGVSAKADALLDPQRLPVFESGRGGQYTYHGPGQRVAYVMLDLSRREKDVRKFVAALEAWVIGALARFNLEGQIREGRVGVWIERSDHGVRREDKIAAIGVKLRHWVSFHGVSLNVEPDLSHYAGIIPCGQTEHGVTSLVDLGLPVTMDEADAALKSAFVDVFGPIRPSLAGPD